MLFYLFFQTINCTFAKNIFAMPQETWYVLGSLKRNQELKIRDELRRANLDCFVPLRYTVKTIKGVKKRLMLPAISGLIFIKGNLEDLQEKIRFNKNALYLRKSTFSNKEDYLTISDAEMQNFIAVASKAGENITYFTPDEIKLQPGDKIRVNGGFFDGREGVIMRIKGKRKKQFVVSIPGVVYAAVELEPEMIELPEKIEHEVSRDVDEDKKALFDLAKRTLFEIPTNYQQEKEYYVLLSELKRTYARLKPMKAYLPAQEAELALPLYMASVKLQQDVPPAEQRLRKAIASLQATSLLKLRCQLYIAILSHDDEAKANIETTFANWKKSKLSPKQRDLISEYESISNNPPAP